MKEKKVRLSKGKKNLKIDKIGKDLVQLCLLFLELSQKVAKRKKERKRKIKKEGNQKKISINMDHTLTIHLLNGLL